MTMRSILRHTDLSLVKEILWVSDGNAPEKIFEKELTALHPKVQVIVNQENKGLIVTKMETAARAQGTVLMFLEPHVVVTSRWLEPLLLRLEQEPRALIMPTMDVLDKEMQVYQRLPFNYWRFEWNLNLIANNPWGRDLDLSRPFPSPGTSGGIYAIRKERGEFFDPELIRWGGDHVEASHKVWRCGGRIEMHPCARVGHWFRGEEDRPYAVKVPDVVKNYKRLAEVWLDNHTDSFYKVKPEARSMSPGDLSNMQQSRQRLSCRSMDWYLQNVDLELAWEEKRICIPGARKDQNGCDSSQPAPGRSSLDKALHQEFRKARQRLSKEFQMPDEF
ncbi:unnamed protein product [Effrenium voratum]|nr:unnamed protein product [Effrenium voratum]